MNPAFQTLDAERPPIPDQTCPIVDRVSAMADAIMGDLERIAEELRNHEDEEHAGEVDETIENLRKYRLLLEELRNSNEELRISGIYWRNCAKRLDLTHGFEEEWKYRRERIANKAALHIRPEKAGDVDYWTLRSAISEELEAAFARGDIA